MAIRRVLTLFAVGYFKRAEFWHRTGSLRPPNDYERRRDLTERMLERPDPDGFEAAHNEYHVTHVVLDSDLMEEFDVDRAALASLPWLTKVYGNDELSVYELDLH